MGTLIVFTGKMEVFQSENYKSDCFFYGKMEAFIRKMKVFTRKADGFWS